MKSIGIIRKVDELGRVVVPVEIRRSLGITVKDPVEMYTEQDRIVIKKYQPACVFCGEPADNIEYRGKLICRACIAKLPTASE